MRREDLLEVVYRFYPRGLFDGLPGYRGSQEWVRQREVARRAAAAHPTWREMLRRLGYSFMDYMEFMRVKSYPEDGDFDPAYSAEIYLPGRTLGFHVCVLGPYYGIQRTGDPSEEAAALAVAREIEATYPGYAPIPPELGDEVVPGVIVHGPNRDVTIYHCLLSKHWELSSYADGEDLEERTRACDRRLVHEPPPGPRVEGVVENIRVR